MNDRVKAITEQKQIDIVATEDELNGPERFAADYVISQEECDALIHLANVSFYDSQALVSWPQ